jgi:arylsulfatase A-like enzyme
VLGIRNREQIPEQGAPVSSMSVWSWIIALLSAALLLGCELREDRPPAAPAAAEPAAPIQPARSRASRGVAVRPRLIVLISLDTLRADHLGIYGSERPTSPVLDSLAREGVIFDDASATSSWTLPSHASMLTGLFPKKHRANSRRSGLPRRIPTLASLLSAQGYTTAAVVNSTWLSPKYGLTRDFEKFVYVQESFERVSPSTWITDQGMEWIRDRGGRPLFLFMHYYDAHGDYTALPKFKKLFVTPYDGDADGTAIQLFLSLIDEAFFERCRQDFDAETCTIEGHIVLDESTTRPQFDERDVRHLEELYDSGIRQLDAELGRFLDFLREQNLMDETLLVITSDHGEEFMEHGGLTHARTQYQEMLRVPLLIRGPGIPANVRIPEPVALVDIVPTILDLARVGSDADVDGLALAPLWLDGDSERFSERVLYGEAPDFMSFFGRPGMVEPVAYHSVRRGRYKLHYESHEQTVELYDLSVDPLERVDVASRRSAPREPRWS